MCDNRLTDWRSTDNPSFSLFHWAPVRGVWKPSWSGCPICRQHNSRCRTLGTLSLNQWVRLGYSWVTPLSIWFEPETDRQPFASRKIGFVSAIFVIPKFCVLGTKAVRFLAENGWKRTQNEENRKQQIHGVRVNKAFANLLEPLEKWLIPID